jgi:hypothetical protein
MDRLFELYKTANEKNSWVRVPVVNYLRACPLPRAKELLQECEKIDPAAVKRANTFFPGAPAAPTPPPNKASQISPGSGENFRPTGAPRERAPTAGQLAEADITQGSPSKDGSALAAAINPGAEGASAVRPPLPPANRWLVVSVPCAVGLLLLVAQWSLLCRHDLGR